MFHSLKAKLTLAFGTLIVFLFVALGFFLVDAKARELGGDIAESTQAFAQFTVESVMENYSLFLEPGNFVPFTREISGILRQNTDIFGVSIASYSGVILYDSVEEDVEQYDGTIRTISEQDELDRVQSTKMSLLLEDGRTIFVKVDEDKIVSYVNINEDPVEPLSTRDRIANITVPFQNAYAVIYDVSYESLDTRLTKARYQIIAAALIGVLLALAVSFMLSVSITNPLEDLKKGALKIGGGDFNARVRVRTKDEVGVLASTFNKMAVDLAASVEAKLYQERVEKELELAAEIQSKLLPKAKIELPSVDIAGGLVPATEVGGDAFDYIPLEDGRYLVYLGDVTGHGVAAGIVSSIANALLYGLRSENILNDIVKHVNDVLKQKTLTNVFMTMALMVWDEKASTVTYTNAGHPPVLYYDAEKRKVVEIKLKGMAMGLTEGLEKMVEEQQIKLKPNDTLVMYSDGVPEAVNPKKEMYGIPRLKRIVQDAANDLYTADGIKNAILSDVVEFIGGKEYTDDMTVVVLKGKQL